MALLVSCRQKSIVPSTEFATYIKAYTGGRVPSSSSIRIEFACDVNPVEETDLFSFSPSLKGEMRWLSSSAVEFTPEEGALSPGTRYKASFKLSEVTDVRDAGLKTFQFQFLVEPRSAQLSLDGVRITADDPSTASVSGTVTFSETVPASEVAGMLSASCGGSQLAVTMPADGSGRVFDFTIGGIKRGADDGVMTLHFDGSAKGFKDKQDRGLVIPGTSGFKVISSELHDGADPYVDIRFSEPLDASASDKGFITLSDVGRYYTQVDANQIKVYFDSMTSKSVGLKVSSLLSSYDDSRLGQDYTESFTSSALKPEVRYAFEGSILPDEAQLILPFHAIGLHAVDVSVIKIYEDNILMFLQENFLDGGSELRRAGRLVYKNTIRLDEDPTKNLHEWNLYSVDLSDMFRKEPGAIYRIRLSFNLDQTVYGTSSSSSGASLISISGGQLTQADQDVWDEPNSYYYENFYDWDSYDWKDTDNPMAPSYYMESGRFPVCNLLTSNIGIIAKSAGTGKFWVAATDIMTAEPLKGAEVTAYSYQLQTVGKGKTDSDGFVELTTTSKPFAVAVREGKHTGYLRVVDGEEKSMSRFDTGGETLSSGLKGFVYGERGVWRPGDTLHVSLMVEDREKVIPESHPVTMELYSPQGQFYAKQVNTKGMKGLYAFEIPTSQSDPTGTWNAYFKVGGATFHKSLQIETVKPNRLKISLEPKDAILTAGKPAAFELTSSWLTGPAASGLKSEVSMRLYRRNSGFKGYEGYSFNDPVSEFSSSESVLFEKNLNSEGKLSTTVTMPKTDGAPGLLTAHLITNVMEPGGDVSIVTQNMPFAPYKSFVGVKLTDGETYETDSDHGFPVVVVDAQGKPVSGDQIEYRIYKLDWSWWWESGRESLDSYVNGRSAAPVSQGSFVSSSSPSKISFRVDYPEWGRYLVYVKDMTSGHASGGIIYMDWPSWRGRSDKSDPNALTMLSFNTDKKSYDVGEDVTVFIPSAHDGHALVSLENGRGVISRTWVNTTSDGDCRYKFKVTEDMTPNFYIHVTMLQPHKHTANDLPLRMYGVQPVLVSNKKSHVEPVISMPDVLRPQEEFTVTVKEKNHKPMTYTLAIVDEGLLDITSFKTPDPWAAMNSREALGVKTWDLFDQVIGAYSGRFSPLMSIGGDIDLQMGNKKDNRFNPVVKFYGPFTLTKGEQKHRITLPMYVGSVRVMVVAGQDGAYGNAEKAVPVRTPLMVLPTLPRTLGTGEKVTLPVNVFAMEDNIRNVKVSVSVDGPASVASASSTSLSFSAKGDKLASFALETGAQEGVAKVTVTAESGSHKAQETISIEVRNPSAPSVESRGALVKAGKTERFSFPAFQAGGDSQAKLQLSNFPAVDFDGLFTYVLNYRYDCTEQLASKGMTLVYTRKFLNESNAAKADEMIASILQTLYGRQLPDGGFAYWPGQAYADDWATSMAGQFMAEASSMGYGVNKGVLASWKKFQKKASSNYKHMADKYSQYDLQQAYRLYTMAVAGASDDGGMNRLKAAPEISQQARWRLAAAYAVAGKKNVATQLTEQLDTQITDSAPGLYTYGAEKDQAMMLETAVLADEMQVAMELAEDVAKTYADGGFGTQYSAFAALAMSRLAGKVGDGAIEVALTPGQTVKSAKSSFSVDVDPSSGSLEVKNLSSCPVYAALQTRRQAVYGETVPARSSNLTVSVKYTDMNGREVSPASLRQGQEFKADIIVAGTSAVERKHLALTQMIPSGWEVFNDRLFGASAEPEGYDYKDIRDDRVIWYFDLPASGRRLFTVRLQAAYAGEFVLPAVTCEAMYDPDTHANTASGKTVVAQ